MQVEMNSRGENGDGFHEECTLLQSRNVDYASIPMHSNVELKTLPTLQVDKEETGNKLSNFEVLVSLLKGNVGAGALSLPFAFSKAGIIASPPLFCIIAGICTYNMLALLSCKKLLERKNVRVSTYGDVGMAVLGKYGKLLIDVFLIITQFSVCTVYFTYISTNIYKSVIPESWKTHMDERTLIILVYPVLLRFSWIKRLHKMSPFTAIASVAVVIGIIVIFYFTFDHFPISPNAEDLPKCNWSQLPIFYGSAVYSFEGIGLVLPIERSMKDPQHFRSLLLGSMVGILILFVFLGELPVLSFGVIDTGSMTAVLEQFYTGFVIHVTNILLAVATMLTFPLQLYPAIEIIELALIEPYRPYLTSEVIERKKMTLRSVICTAMMLIALMIPNVGMLISLLGSMGSSALCIIFPPLLRYKLVPEEKIEWKILHVATICIGIVGMVFGTVDSLWIIFEEH